MLARFRKTIFKLDEKSHLPMIRELTKMSADKHAHLLILEEMFKSADIKFYLIDDEFKVLYSSCNVTDINQMCNNVVCRQKGINTDCPLIRALKTNKVEFFLHECENNDSEDKRMFVCSIPLKNNGEKLVFECVLDVSKQHRSDLITMLKGCIKTLEGNNDGQ